jgi:ABC-type glycerol-3-phosphate transport system substrate-binding protein
MNKITKLGMGLAMGVLLLTQVGCRRVVYGSDGTLARDESEIWTEDGRMKLSYFNWDMTVATSSKREDTYFWNLLESKFNVKLDLKSAGYSSWEQELNNYVMADEFPDIFINNGFEKELTFKTWIKEGMVAPMTPDPVTYPNLANKLKQYEKTTLMTDDKAYNLPLSYAANEEAIPYQNHVFYIRTDWLRAVGLDMPNTMEEFREVLRRFSNKSQYNLPNAAAKTYGLGLTKEGGLFWWYPFFNLFGIEQAGFTKDAQGKYQADIISDSGKEAMKFLTDIYNDGSIDPAYETKSLERLKDDFVAGKIGCFAYNSGVPFAGNILTGYRATYPSGDPLSDISYMAPIKGITGERKIQAAPNYWCTTSISGYTHPKQREKIYEILDWMLSEEGLNTLALGIEGVHWKKEGDKIINLIPKDNGKERCFIGYDPSADVLKRLVTLDRLNWIAHYGIEYYDFQDASTKPFVEAAYVPETYYVRVPNDTLPLTITSNLTGIEDEKLFVIIKNISKFEDNWTKFVNQWKKDGGDLYVSAFNKTINERPSLIV